MHDHFNIYAINQVENIFKASDKNAMCVCLWQWIVMKCAIFKCKRHKISAINWISFASVLFGFCDLVECKHYYEAHKTLARNVCNNYS